jgi:DnaJ-class molecular chaperone
VPIFDPEVNYYQILGLKKSATPKQVRQGYYKMAKQFHPDLISPAMRQKMTDEQINQKF